LSAEYIRSVEVMDGETNIRIETMIWRVSKDVI